MDRNASIALSLGSLHHAQRLHSTTGAATFGAVDDAAGRIRSALSRKGSTEIADQIAEMLRTAAGAAQESWNEATAVIGREADAVRDLADHDIVILSTSAPADRHPLNEPPPSSMIVVDARFVYETDDLGRVVRAGATLTDVDLDHPRDHQAQRTLSGKLPGDHAGHLFARIFQGPGQKLNLVPMEGLKVNKGVYATIENEWRAVIAEGGQVPVEIRLGYGSDDRRPRVIRVKYRHPGGVTRRRITNDPAVGDRR